MIEILRSLRFLRMTEWVFFNSLRLHAGNGREGRKAIHAGFNVIYDNQYTRSTGVIFCTLDI